jgi:hypothetical protein
MAAAGYSIEVREGKRTVPLSELEEVEAGLEALDLYLESVGQVDAIVGILADLLRCITHSSVLTVVSIAVVYGG